MFDINPTNGSPIWRQIEDGMRRMITLGTLRPGDVVPSVRELAQTLRVNPNTVARAYQRLTDSGLFAVRRGEGTYVSATPTAPKDEERSEKLREAAVRYAGAAIAVGASVEDAVSELEQSYEKLVDETRRPS